jgi:hypothetical protein
MKIFSTSEGDLNGSFWEVRAPRHNLEPNLFSRELPRSVVITLAITVCVLGAVGFIAGAYPSLSLESAYLEWPPGFG